MPVGQVNPTLQAALLGAGVGGLGGLIAGRDRLRDVLLFAALGAGLGGGGQYLAQRGGELFAPAGKKERPAPSAAPQPTGGMAGVGRRLLGYGAGGAAGGLVQRQRLQRGRQRARVGKRRLPTKGRTGRGIVTGLGLTALLDYLTSTAGPLRD